MLLAKALRFDLQDPSSRATGEGDGDIAYLRLDWSAKETNLRRVRVSK
jgi:hypothetical protein